MDHRVYFEYDADFLKTGLNLSPHHLPPRSGVFEHTDREYGPVFGLFLDALPDGWGLMLMDRDFAQIGLRQHEITVLDRLAYMGARGMGALTFEPRLHGMDHAPPTTLVELEAAATRVVGGSAEELLMELRIAGGSPGGARPKVLAGLSADGRMLAGAHALPPGFEPLMVKFPATGDHPDIGAVEYAYAQMARMAGIRTADSRLVTAGDGRRYFAAKLFDRTPERRLHMHSFGGLLHASHRLPSLDYDTVLRTTQSLTRDRRQVDEMIRRMVFNVIAHNRDDHTKNTSYLMDRTGTWTLSPAYDLVFSYGPGGEHSMAVGGEGRSPTLDDLLRVTAPWGTTEESLIRDVVRPIQEVVDAWPEFAKATDVPHSEMARISEELGRVRILQVGPGRV